MGFIGLALLAVSAATTVMQQAQARKAAREQREANSVSNASQRIQDRVARRRALREARIRQAIIQNSAAQSGAMGSSGESGAISALGSNLGASFANQRSQQLASEGITAANQKVADAESAFDRIGAFGKLVSSGISIWDQYKQG